MTPGDGRGKIAASFRPGPLYPNMFETLTVALPVFGFVAAGYGLGRTALFDAERAKGLTAYVFWFAVPLLLFRGGAALAGGGGAGFDLRVLAAYFGASFAIYVAAFLLNRGLFDGQGAEPPLAAMTAAYGNSVMMGIPLAELFFGPAGLAIATAIIACSSLAYYGLTVLLIEVRLGRNARLGGIAAETARALVRTPVILAMAAGLAFGAAGFELHGVAARFVDIGAAAAAPTALFALGATLAGFRIAGDVAEAAAVGALKLVANPVLAWTLAGPVLGLAPGTVAAVTMMAALPCAVNPFLLAGRYEAYARRASAAIVLSTAASVITVAVAVTLAI